MLLYFSPNKLALIFPLRHASVLPKKGPEIHGTQPYYRVGDLVNVTCRAGASKPPAMLTWYINNEKVSKYPL
ncbi:hypothetical protein HPB48_005679 [Haemaphysalis longicornis]|uniref:Ig-like domain-containing protein n=1 Tax=Haemaphysalis longicornis TaxID=44386 RepID=A0A9J6GL87_HAELO|nr:hypothetical protein HPB48_005679 [Haemaphysalis longicornis]